MSSRDFVGSAKPRTTPKLATKSSRFLPETALGRYVKALAKKRGG